MLLTFIWTLCVALNVSRLAQTLWIAENLLLPRKIRCCCFTHLGGRKNSIHSCFSELSTVHTTRQRPLIGHPIPGWFSLTTRTNDVTNEDVCLGEHISTWLKFSTSMTNGCFLVKGILRRQQRHEHQSVRRPEIQESDRVQYGWTQGRNCQRIFRAQFAWCILLLANGKQQKAWLFRTELFNQFRCGARVVNS